MKTLCILLVSCLVLITSCNKDNNPVDEGTNTPPLNSFDTTLSNTSQDITVNVNGLLTIFIPKNIIPGGTKLSVSQLDPAGITGDPEYTFLSLFDISLGSLTQFTQPLIISLPFSPDKLLNNKFKYKLGVSYLNEKTQKWTRYSDVKVDTIKNIITFSTNHLTKISPWGYSAAFGYTDWTTRLHFNIYWKEGDVPTNSEYHSPFASTNVGSDPHYVQDIGYYLERAYEKFTDKGLYAFPGKADVYIKDLNGPDGETSFFGYIKFSNNIQGEPGVTVEKAIPQTCAHELLHYIQDYYYMQLFSDHTVKWWLEATAVLGGLLAFPDITPYESETYANSALTENLVNAWDVCNGDPNYYVAGGFLTYLALYRPGTKADIAKLIIDCGSATNLSFIRTIIDDYLKTNLHSVGIGKEFYDYILWAYEGTGTIKLPPTPLLKYGNSAYVIPQVIDQSFTVNKINVSVNNLAVKMIKMQMNDNTTRIIKAELNNCPADLICDVYKRSSTESIKIGTLTPGNPLSIELSNDKQWADVMFINKSKDNSLSADITLGLTPSITSLSPDQGKVGDQVTITGTNFGTDKTKGTVTFNGVPASSTDIQAWTNTQIIVKVPAGATTGSLIVTINGSPSNSKTFTVTSATVPVISDISPNPATTGKKITITGLNFGTDQTKAEVIFASLVSVKTFVSFTNTQIEVNVPANAVTGDVYLKIDGKFSNHYKISIGGVPVITSIAPDSGKQLTFVQIIGTNFGTDASKGEVYFSGTTGSIQATTINYWADKLIVAQVPVGAQTGNVQVKVNGNLSNGVMFKSLAPIITSISPDFSYGGRIIIYGSNLAGTSKVKINTLELPASTNDTLANVTLPLDIPGGLADISLIIDGQETNKLKYFLGIPQWYLNTVTKVNVAAWIFCNITQPDGTKNQTTVGQMHIGDASCQWSGNSFTITAGTDIIAATMNGTVSNDGLTITNFSYEYKWTDAVNQQVFKMKVSEIKMEVDPYDHQGILFAYSILNNELVSKSSEVKGTLVTNGQTTTIDGVSPDNSSWIRILIK